MLDLEVCHFPVGGLEGLFTVQHDRRNGLELQESEVGQDPGAGRAQHHGGALRRAYVPEDLLRLVQHHEERRLVQRLRRMPEFGSRTPRLLRDEGACAEDPECEKDEAVQHRQGPLR
ncbi:MAG: hypothetical protein EA352_11020 [Gemmatimonadales bacterium]|nr:MAG: hypothetical protein EA352_11020 [Gemmatimonadales bacterium]